MAVFQLVILKGVEFHGRIEEFSNVYQLNTGTGESFEDEAAIDSVVALERGVFAEAVEFISAVTYEGDAGNLTPRFRKIIQLPGLAPTYDLYRECAVLVTQELPRSGFFGLGRRRFLRKWLHTCSFETPTSGAGSNVWAQGHVPLDAAYKDALLADYWTPLATQEHGGGRLSGPNGDYPLDAPGPFVDDYLEHRQFHR